MLNTAQLRWSSSKSVRLGNCRLGLAVDFEYAKYNNSSDDQVVRASASGAVDLGLIPSRVKAMTLKLVFTSSLLDVQH